MDTIDSTMRGFRARWRLEEPIPAELRTGLGTQSMMVSHLLYCRGFRTPEQIEAFLSGHPVSHDPFLLEEMDRVVARIVQAANAGETVAVYGDFDCDGVASTAVLMEALRGVGLDPIPYLPVREDGHGLSPEGLATLADRGVTLVITADCGITAVDEVEVARGMGMEVIITDHHEPRPDGSLPRCPVIAPTRLDSSYPFRSLCGTGVAYKVAQALHERIAGALDPASLLDLVALGTIADVVPLVDENRSLVVLGLRALRESRRPGVLALLAAAGIEQRKIDPTAVAFYLAPRINAANRLASPQLAYDLITASEHEIARDLAGRLSGFNTERQTLVERYTAELTARLGDPLARAEAVATGDAPPILVVVGDWSPGISGLLASKLVDLYGLPAFAGAPAGEGVVAFSGRGTPGARLDELLERCHLSVPDGLFLGHGGHARAAGFRVGAGREAEAQAVLEVEARRMIAPEATGLEIVIDAQLPLHRLTLDAAQRVRALAPFGMGFSEPLFLSRNVLLRERRPLKDGRHARVTVQDATGRVSGVCFGVPREFYSVPLGTPLDIVYHLQINEWQETQRPEIQLKDWRIAS